MVGDRNPMFGLLVPSNSSRLSPEQPRMEQIDVPNGSAVESTCLYSVTTHVVTSYSQIYSNGGYHVEEHHIVMSVSFSGECSQGKGLPCDTTTIPVDSHLSVLLSPGPRQLQGLQKDRRSMLWSFRG